MNGDIHKPELPGTRTYTKDIISHSQRPTKKKGDTDQSVHHYGTGNEPLVAMNVPKKTVVVKIGAEKIEPKIKEGSILTNKDDVFDVGTAFKGDGQMGTIVTDKRRERSRFMQIAGAALSEWLEDTSENLKELGLFAPEVEQKVTPAEARKEVITKASKFGKQSPRDDHELVIEKLKEHTNKKENKNTSLILKKSAQKTKKEPPQWSHFEETRHSSAYSTLPVREEKMTVPTTPPTNVTEVVGSVAVAPTVQRPKQQNVVEVVAAETSPQTQIPVPSVPQPVAKQEVAETLIQPTKQKSIWSFFSSKQKKKEVGNQDTETKTATGDQEAPESKSSLIGETDERTHTPNAHIPFPTFPSKKLSGVASSLHSSKTTSFPSVEAVPIHPRTQEEEKPVSHKTERRVWRTFAFGVASLIGIVGGAAAVFYVANHYEGTSPAPVETAISVRSFFPVDSQTPVSLSATKSDLVASIDTTLNNAPSGVHQIYPTVTKGSETSPATTEEILSVISPHMSGTFRRSLDEHMMVGWAAGSWGKTPYLVLKSDSFDTSFAGMIVWETYLSEDLAPLFGLPVSGTFVDTVSSNQNIRVLTDQHGFPHILYAFVGSNTIVITGDTEALKQIVSRIH